MTEISDITSVFQNFMDDLSSGGSEKCEPESKENRFKNEDINDFFAGLDIDSESEGMVNENMEDLSVEKSELSSKKLENVK